MKILIYNLYFLVFRFKSKEGDFIEIIRMQTNNILILGNKAFLVLKEKKLKEVEFQVKFKEFYGENALLVFNRCKIIV